jgi:Alpha-amylase/alpha-mannosidase
MQQEAVRALASLYPFVRASEEPGLKRLWKTLTISDHFYYMATKFGTIEEVHAYFSPFKNASIAYGLFMEALGVLSELIQEKISEKPGKIASKLILPMDKAFYFTMPDGSYTGVYARSLMELYTKIGSVPLESAVYHLRSGHIQAWIEQALLLKELSKRIRELTREVDDPVRLVELVRKEISSYLQG